MSNLVMWLLWNVSYAYSGSICRRLRSLSSHATKVIRSYVDLEAAFPSRYVAGERDVCQGLSEELSQEIK